MHHYTSPGKELPLYIYNNSIGNICKWLIKYNKKHKNMAALHGGGNYSAPGDGDGDGEAPPPPTTAAECRRGGWTAAPFIIGTYIRPPTSGALNSTQWTTLCMNFFVANKY